MTDTPTVQSDQIRVPPRGPLLGIDHGAKVIGLAICDGSWIVARPLGLLERKSREVDFGRIRELIAKHHIVGIVVGIPITPDDFDAKSQARTVQRWMTRLAAAVEAPVYGWDERYSTFEAHLLAEEAGVELQGRIDDRAAAVILQGFIDAHRPGVPLPSPVKRR
jgi:putative Holliday junction resolvase